MKFRSLHDRVVIRRAEGGVTSKGGIIIPDVAKERPQEREVVAIGPGRRDQSGNLAPLDVKVGDLILNGQTLLIMKEADIMGIVEKTEAAADKAA
ncbi:co-chaperone GroES [Rhizobium sp. 9T]|uniref:10 kDa chaperonin n=1 Tax=Rhizobium croatiense TaxID=2867516 RepID=A0ABS7LUV7_9HYPH|nr:MULTISPECIES: co-chaperone GroES [Rhizobium]MBY4607758.1 co-chaperone GroES [Rhizobium croatiense]MBY4628635.1 co-chaperone GroES [Rhizobium croatiense]PDV88462.1 co-chaperone GroES [Rhizobium sp. H4]WET74832.1 co-chaperone GroES [Rhizobium croatiense]